MNTNTFNAQTPMALLAIGTHIHAHKLPTPIDIEFDHPGRRIIIRLRGWDTRTQATWLNSVHVDHEHNEHCPPFSTRHLPYLRTTWDVRLPDTGLRVRIKALRDLPLLQAVTA